METRERSYSISGNRRDGDPKYLEPKKQRPRRRRRRHYDAFIWKLISLLCIVLLLISVRLGMKSLDLVSELTNDLKVSMTELAKLQEAYKQATGIYWVDGQPIPNATMQSFPPSSSDKKTFDEPAPTTVEEPIQEEEAPENEEPVPEPEPEPEPEIPQYEYPSVYDEIPLNGSLIQYIYDSATEAGIKPEVMFALGWKETNFEPWRISATEDYGLFQINKCNFEDISKEFGIPVSAVPEMLVNDPFFNTQCSVWIIKGLIDSYNPEDYHQLLMIYNMGYGNAKKAFRSGYYSTEYSRKVVNYASQEYGLDDPSL